MTLATSPSFKSPHSNTPREYEPTYGRLNNNRGVAYYNKGAVDRAIANYDQVIRLDPKDAIAFSNRGLRR